VCSDDADDDGSIDAACGGDDCDLAIDDEDPDCSLCLPAGAACSSGADCCSGRCRWLLRTCR